MGIEIERKFLLANDGWKESVSERLEIVQFYLCADPARTVRIRRQNQSAFITIKGKATAGSVAVPEFEYAIPVADVANLMKLAAPGTVEKTRHIVIHQGSRWEIDVFAGDNAGLAIAEIELENENAAFEKPVWLGAEVTADPRYKNSALAIKPYTAWKDF